jgi:hypothetical protein
MVQRDFFPRMRLCKHDMPIGVPRLLHGIDPKKIIRFCPQKGKDSSDLPSFQNTGAQLPSSYDDYHVSY